MGEEPAQGHLGVEAFLAWTSATVLLVWSLKEFRTKTATLRAARALLSNTGTQGSFLELSSVLSIALPLVFRMVFIPLPQGI